LKSVCQIPFIHTELDLLRLSIGNQKSDERSFYEIEAANQNWTVRELKRQFSSGLYERLAQSRDKTDIRKLSEKGHMIYMNLIL